MRIAVLDERETPGGHDRIGDEGRRQRGVGGFFAGSCFQNDDEVAWTEIQEGPSLSASH